MNEFALIAHYFKRPAHHAAIVLGVGDDCAVLTPPAGQQLLITTDTLIEGRHFFSDVSPADLAYKTLAVSLSDLAACGAQPVAFTLNLSLPKHLADPAFLLPFSDSLWALADASGCHLIGGDTTQSARLMLAVTAFGQAPHGSALLRSGAQVGDDIWVSGTLGCAAAGLAALQGKPSITHNADCIQRLLRPTPRLALGVDLRGIASAALDLSDGLAGDIMHLLRASGVGAQIELADLPSSAGFVAATQALLPEQRWAMQLGGGDDYELLFTAPVSQRSAVQAAASAAQTQLTRIGHITQNNRDSLSSGDNSVPNALQWTLHGKPHPLTISAYEHFT